MTENAYPVSYLRHPLHVAQAVEQIRQALIDPRAAILTGRSPATGAPGTVAQLASLHGVLASLAAQISDEITARSDVHARTAASRTTTDMFVDAS
ncbi:hypothetical protein OG948_01025 [Embleya sp. NBC_00888]|uniref:hypothetical protein n=1 Tax=Embleya sp. NBC_00888 TaxID=2975960 RepID=UPI00386CC0C5|nr:hypothetical protein OG948_01025 [Embleya sp. NBC_00888]